MHSVNRTLSQTLPTEFPIGVTCAHIKDKFMERGVLSCTDQKTLNAFLNKHCDDLSIESDSKPTSLIMQDGKKIAMSKMKQFPTIISMNSEKREIDIFSTYRKPSWLYKQINNVQVMVQEDPCEETLQRTVVGFTNSTQNFQAPPTFVWRSHPSLLFDDLNLITAVNCPLSQKERLFQVLINLPSEKVSQWSELSPSQLKQAVNAEFACYEGINPIAVLGAAGIAAGAFLTLGLLAVSYDAYKGRPDEKLKDTTWKHYAFGTALFTVFTAACYMFWKDSDIIANKLAMRLWS